MPGQLKEVRSRIKSVQNTQQITKAMKMVSAAKLRKATDRIVQMRPYANKLNEIMSNIAAGSGGNIALAIERPIKNVLMVVVTSDRGLAGAFNANTIKLTKHTIAEKYAESIESPSTRTALGSNIPRHNAHDPRTYENCGIVVKNRASIRPPPNRRSDSPARFRNRHLAREVGRHQVRSDSK